ncbi:MAG: GHKL domain-containing protein [Ferruginibacter sp.]|nr:GHKL domain-containing protein [Ferruginibacter sp.]
MSLLLVSISVFTNQKFSEKTELAKATKILQRDITKAENNFNSFIADSTLISNITTKNFTDISSEKLLEKINYLFVYKINDKKADLIFWDTQTTLPDSALIFFGKAKELVALENGYFFAQRKISNSFLFITLMPVKWNYAITNNYLQNTFANKKIDEIYFSISKENADTFVKTNKNDFLFSLVTNKSINTTIESKITIWLRILAFFPVFIFLHLLAEHIYKFYGAPKASIFLFTSLLFIRFFSYFNYQFFNLRQFELFNPAIYGSGIVLRSLGDLFINIMFLLWVVFFVESKFTKLIKLILPINKIRIWALMPFLAFFVLLITQKTCSIIQTLVSDSKISFDVLNFFSLDFFGVVALIILCGLALSHFYLCKIILVFLKKNYQNNFLFFLLLVAIEALVFLSFQIGNTNIVLNLILLSWLLLFLIILYLSLTNKAINKSTLSAYVFWIIYFSLSISGIIIYENTSKELQNRKHYAEIIASKTSTINDAILNSVLTDFKSESLTQKFYLFKNKVSSLALKDSLTNNIFSSFNNTHETNILVFDKFENPLHNNETVTYNAINSILNTQGKPTNVPGVFLYDVGFDKYNYIFRREIQDSTKNLLGYIFVIINSRKSSNKILYPELFNRGHYNSIDNSLIYSYATYENNILVTSHNNYNFTAKYNQFNFGINSFLQIDKKEYNELWYKVNANKFIVIVKENKYLLEFITLFSYLFYAFIIIAIFFSFFTYLYKIKFKIINNLFKTQINIKQQVLGSIIFFSILSFIIIGIATILFFVNKSEDSNRKLLSNSIRAIKNDLTSEIEKNISVKNALQATQNFDETYSLQSSITKLSNIHSFDVNFYDTLGYLRASSILLPYEKGIISKKISPIAYTHLYGGKEIQFYQNESIGKLNFVSIYMPVTICNNKVIGYLNIPFFTSGAKLKDEISNFLVTIINLNAFILIIAGIVSLFIANRIANSFSFITNKMKNIHLEKQNEPIIWHRKDEIGDLVLEYNKMVKKLDESAAALAKKERESAWQEMAKQVAHEIKNPLTPMKLSMQFLQKAIDENAPNIKDLSIKVSETLVTQIDHLSFIAGEFSRFANIENAKPTNFNLTETLISLKQLYSTYENSVFNWHIILKDVFIFSDKTQINSLFNNLILNAIQSVSNNKKAIITINQIVKNNFVELTISDNGDGIKEEMQSKIFTPNFTTKTSGTGLGLAMCKRIVEQAGGTISFQTSSKGTTFLVVLPLA